LANLARKFIIIPATSVPSERLFSDAGNIVSKRRVNLDPETVKALVFMYENQEFVKYDKAFYLSR